MERLLRLNTEEQRYVSSCALIPGREFYDEAVGWRERVKQDTFSGRETDYDVPQIARAFPHLATLYTKGFFEHHTPLGYFEGIDLKSHNMRMYLFAKKLLRNKNIPESMLEAVCRHLHECSVRVMKNCEMHSFKGVYRGEPDFGYFDAKPAEYLFVHGRDLNPIAVKEASLDDFARFNEFFERFRTARNPFNLLVQQQIHGG
jgi:hypothetical protein